MEAGASAGVSITAAFGPSRLAVFRLASLPIEATPCRMADSPSGWRSIDVVIDADAWQSLPVQGVMVEHGRLFVRT